MGNVVEELADEELLEPGAAEALEVDGPADDEPELDAAGDAGGDAAGAAAAGSEPGDARAGCSEPASPPITSDPPSAGEPFGTSAWSGSAVSPAGALEQPASTRAEQRAKASR
jgi:hypothetical protein